MATKPSNTSRTQCKYLRTVPYHFHQIYLAFLGQNINYSHTHNDEKMKRRCCIVGILRIWNDTAMDYIKVLPRYLPENTEDKNENSVSISNSQKPGHDSTSRIHDYYRYTNHLRILQKRRLCRSAVLCTTT